ncbi:hypothetical protein GCM10007216_09400 [Thalassobacillus devorans]|uniref:ABC-2 type transport system permease protein n=1 Tax=Thalassobacillus devorans TaxID=279813 RepID=A0ABQ1NRC2_9BACI|nr:hypothetical protein [Thalassobacillus devorans]NIK29120.1 hypothetical protein [Thalassobacillus devorans]GGC81005.1 hypothetical protein GCM10007216_09400 [Thalassobacillus devorans]
MKRKAFTGLWKKEWTLMKTYYLILLLVGLGFAVGVSGMVEDVQLFMLTAMVLILHMFILAALVMFSLNREADQLELFLHNPQSTYMLVGVKFLQSLSFMTVSMTVFGLITIITAGDWIILSLRETALVVFIANIFILGQAILLAVFLLFLWVLHQVLKTYLGGLSILISILLFISLMAVTSWIRESSFYEQIAGWGTVQINIDGLTGDFLNVFGMTVHGGVTGGFPIVLGEVAAWALTVGLLYVVSVVVLDRKVEV